MLRFASGARGGIAAWLPDHPAIGQVVAGALLEGGGEGSERIVLTADGREARAICQAAAEGRGLPIFVYGTLLPGEALHGHLAEFGVRSIVPARVPGRLLDLGPYPGAFFEGGEGQIEGEVIEVEDLAGALVCLDEVEGFAGWGASGSLFRRTLVDVGEGMAWAYELASRELEGRVIASGSWRRRGVRSTSGERGGAIV